MKRRPWFKFHTQDWRADPALRMCSLGARGLWADLLSIMHEAEPYGHLLVGSVAPSTAQLARLLSTDEALLTPLIGELEANGVFSRDDDGVIYSRRMVRDAEVADEARGHVAKRWGKSTKSRGVTSAPIKDPNRGPIAENGADPNTKSQKSESENTSLLRARTAAFDAPLWRGRVEQAIELAGEALFRTNPVHKMPTVFRNLCEPLAGEPCDWDLDVLPAIGAAAARGARFDKWDYIKPAAIENRDRRLAGLPDPKPIKANGGGHQPRRAGLGDAFLRIAAEQEQAK